MFDWRISMVKQKAQKSNEKWSGRASNLIQSIFRSLNCNTKRHNILRLFQRMNERTHTHTLGRHNELNDSEAE